MTIKVSHRGHSRFVDTATGQTPVAKPPALRHTTFERIILEHAAKMYGLRVADIMRPGRELPRNAARVRHIAIYLVRAVLGRSYPELVPIFRCGNHSSAMSAVKIVERRMKAEPIFAEQIAILLRHMKAAIDDARKAER